MIRFATYEDVPALMEIRRQCFGEEEAFLRFYFTTRFTETNTLVYVADGAPVASLTLLDAEVLTPERRFPVAYVYAVATLPQWRRKGLAQALSCYADDYLRGRGVEASLLVPASTDLFDYYAKLGYATCFYVDRKEEAKRVMADSVLGESQALLAADYFRLREKAYAKSGYFVQWSIPALEYALQECRQSGGLALWLRVAGQEGFFLAYPEPERIIIKESLLDGALLPWAFKLLREYFGESKPFVFQSGGDKPAQPFAMLKAYTPAACPPDTARPYFGLPKD